MTLGGSQDTLPARHVKNRLSVLGIAGGVNAGCGGLQQFRTAGRVGFRVELFQVVADGIAREEELVGDVLIAQIRHRQKGDEPLLLPGKGKGMRRRNIRLSGSHARSGFTLFLVSAPRPLAPLPQE